MRQAYLVYVKGTRGMEPQVWYSPLVNRFGKITVKPQGLIIVGEPIPLPLTGSRWTPEGAEAFVLRDRKTNAA